MSVPTTPESLRPELDALTTPLAWSDEEGAIVGCNAAFSRWLGVGARRLMGWPLAGLDGGEGRLAGGMGRVDATDAPLRVRRSRLRYADGEAGFADVWLSGRRDGGGARGARP